MNKSYIVDLLPIKSSGKTDSLGIGLKLDLFSSLLRRLILSDSPQLLSHFCQLPISPSRTRQRVGLPK